jgi:starch-binding outer membrane protein, SusD/RagB family
MKKKIIYLGCLIAMLLATSCSDSFLNVESPDKESIDEYYNSQSRIFEALVAAYGPLEWFDYSFGEYNPILTMSDIMADDVWVGGADRTDNKFWHLMANYEALPTQVMTNAWTTCYSGINRSNNVMYYMDDVKSIPDATKNLYIAEAKVLRAYYYTLLWKFWGNIPYYTKNLSYPYIQPQSKADDVYAGIIADLDDAIKNGGLPMKADASEYGRVTLAMAYMLYAEVVMYQNDASKYDTALQYMNNIISSAKYQLVSNYDSIWTKGGEWCDESIWEINYKNVGAIRSWGNPQAAGGTVLPRLISPKDWTDGTAGRDNGWAFEPVRKETYNMFEAGDTRRDATIFNASKYTYTKRYEDTGYFLNKYMARTGYNAGQKADADLNYGNNLRIYRYSETLLNAAELLVRGAKGTGDAKTYLNMVHKRSGLTDVVDATIDNILQERRWEFVGEGKRYWDLIRTGNAAKVLVPDTYGYRTNSWTDKKKYLPIPQGEIDAAQGTLTQNNY